jgi:hypothetical protein
MAIEQINDDLTYLDHTGHARAALGVQVLAEGRPQISNPYDVVPFISLNTANPLVLKDSPGKLISLLLTNEGTAAYVKFYDKATAPSEADTPVFTSVQGANGWANTIFNLYRGWTFQNGIAIRVTGALAKTDTTAVAAGQVYGGFCLV